ncbi:MAG TPA: amidohydrolase family protein [Chthoniobacterales bacterium]|nr:amidohydrolase family protein [Chthoniobacterales bacterium]
MIIRARVVVTMDGPPIDAGAAVVAADRIIDVGKFSDIKKKHPADEVLDLGDQVLLPGLINAHCHLDYTRLRGKIPRQKSFTDWIRAINAEKAKLSAEDYVGSITEGFVEAKRFGTTTIANLTAFPELVSRIESPVRTWWFAELIDVRDPGRANQIVDRGAEQLSSRQHWGLAPHARFTASAELYRRCENVALRENILLTTHLAESREEMQMFRDGRGPLHDFLKEIGRDVRDCGKATPTEYFFGKGDSPSGPRVIEDNRPYLLVHMNALLESDFKLLTGVAKNSSIVHCPRSHEYFGHPSFQFEKLRELGLNICLGTDSLASNDDLSLLAEMRTFQREFPGVPPDEILNLVTVNSARALKQEKNLGKIRRDFLADLIAIPITGSTSVFEDVIAFDRTVDWSMQSGRISPGQ